ncbi:LexA family transcriptional regulator [Pantoea sp. BAV 3049]|uniref:LexA family protein n=1 Tax=Pantoea sp. BAV 3049 TaxID=2654188 RepID=UPI00131E37B6|nr:hypothetical protein [Pantoea sp. BAV 3049]
MKRLTETQQATLDFIRGYIRENRLAPTYSEIASGMGWKSANSADEHVRSLIKKGHLKKRRGASRGLVLTDSAAVETCQWSYSDEPDYHWIGACGMAWWFSDDGPAENNFKFCPGCGKPVKIDEQEAEDE